MRTRLVLILAAVLVVLAGNLAVPVLDEELWLSLGRALDAGRPYDWARAMPPWGQNPGDSYLFAHPPGFLWWVWAACKAGLEVTGTRWLAGLPAALIFAFAAGKLASRAGRPLLAGALWLSAPVVVMGLQRGLMPDALAAALATAAVACWLEDRRGWLVAGGLLLGAAMSVKYPAGLALLGILAHGVSAGRLRRCWPFFAAMFAVFVGLEGWLWLEYGRIHLLTVLESAPQIARGPLNSRALGVLARLGFVACPLLILSGRSWILGFLLGGAALAWGWPEGLAGGQSLALLGYAVAGGALFAFMLQCSMRRPMLRCSISLPERRLYAVWALAVVFGVVLGHNYASPRYLLAAALPLSLLLVASAPARLGWVLVAAQAALSTAMGLAEAGQVRAAEAVADAVVMAFPGGGSFSGEWTWRYALERPAPGAGPWRWTDGPAPAGGVLVAPAQSAPQPVPDNATRVASFTAGEAPGSGGLILLDAAAGVGFYAETLGPLPLGWSAGPLEEARVYVVAP